MIFYSPLRYPGGKSKTAPLFAKIIDENNLRGCVYLEPFAGGASVALFLLIEGYASKIIINDADPSIFSFWHSILYKTNDFCKLLRDTPINIEQWRKQKDIYSKQRMLANNEEKFDCLSLGFATFFLNRTNRSGIIKGGLIGGLQQIGDYTMCARFNKTELEKRILNIAKYGHDIEVHCKDAKQFIKEQSTILPDNSIFYFDPPYVVKGRGLYMNYFNENDHRELADAISSINQQKFIVTYDKDPLIADIYSIFRMRNLHLSYSAQVHTSKAQEFIIFSNNLLIPDSKLISKIEE